MDDSTGTNNTNDKLVTRMITIVLEAAGVLGVARYLGMSKPSS